MLCELIVSIDGVNFIGRKSKILHGSLTHTRLDKQLVQMNSDELRTSTEISEMPVTESVSTTDTHGFHTGPQYSRRPLDGNGSQVNKLQACSVCHNCSWHLGSPTVIVKHFAIQNDWVLFCIIQILIKPFCIHMSSCAASQKNKSKSVQRYCLTKPICIFYANL